jgi:xanthine dehydrogenase YagS FAD-binding subunit
MRPFAYTTALTPASAPQLLGGDGRYLGGGIDLLGEMKEYIAEPEVVVNIKALPGLNQIEPGEKAWSIGANVTVAELEDHPELKRTFRCLQQAAAEVGSRQIRNVATRERARTSITACLPATRASARPFQTSRWASPPWTLR